MGRIPSLLILAMVLAFPLPQFAAELDAGIRVGAKPATILWTNPIDIRSRDLFYGPGGKGEQPKEPFTFIEEDHGGTNPKFDVRDAAGTKWKVKLGLEAGPETAATRLMWAVGFVANENYFVRETTVQDMPHHLERGQTLVSADGAIRSARLQRPLKGKKTGNWDWKHNPFVGTREFNGLRVMMALLNNWDLRTVNNAIYADSKDGNETDDPQYYEVTDLGASFGKTGESYRNSISKNNLPAYQKAKFISKVTGTSVTFNFPTHLPILYIFNFPHFVSQLRHRWVGKDIPRSDVKWIGGLLSQLSHEQICDAFRAAGYPPNEVEAFAAAVEKRIAQLNKL
jgi:hypothetical protein